MPGAPVQGGGSSSQGESAAAAESFHEPSLLQPQGKLPQKMVRGLRNAAKSLGNGSAQVRAPPAGLGGLPDAANNHGRQPRPEFGACQSCVRQPGRSGAQSRAGRRLAASLNRDDRDLRGVLIREPGAHRNYAERTGIRMGGRRPTRDSIQKTHVLWRWGPRWPTPL